jgi:ribulose-5-phosphate 4-epimerase/fuculose-1-phosphate aldolase
VRSDDLRTAVVEAAREMLRDGGPVEGQREPSSERRVHLAIYSARHGVVAVGETPAAALHRCVALERQAQIAWPLPG